MKKYIPNKYLFNTVSCQFCVHYYFKSERTLRTLLQNVNDNLEIGGHFIGTCFDGQKIFDLLKGKKEVSGKINNELIWKIKRDYTIRKFDLQKPLLDKKINVFVKSIGNSHTEYLVNFVYFDELLKEYGFEKVKIQNFQEIYEQMTESNLNTLNIKDMSDQEKQFSFLNNAFVYKKVNHTPEYLYSKLVTLIKKENKKEIDSKNANVKVIKI